MPLIHKKHPWEIVLRGKGDKGGLRFGGAAANERRWSVVLWKAIMLILGIETSCDETSVALVESGVRLISSDVASQVGMHSSFGGVVPELASRAHIRQLIPMVHTLLERNGLTLKDVDALAVTLGPGLVGALLVGVETAKGLAFAARKPLIPVHHIAGHLYSPFVIGEGDAFRLIVLGENDEKSEGVVAVSSEESGAGKDPLKYPYVGLVVSGGHSSLVLVRSPEEFEVLGETLDDAAGEAFDKLAKLLSLGYPGGPLVQKHAESGNGNKYELPRPLMTAKGGYNFSFSGLKTAVLTLVNKLGGPEAVRNDLQMLADVCASFQDAAVDVLVRKAKLALENCGTDQLTIVGGVACNKRLRQVAAERLGGSAKIVLPAPPLCTDNAAMIAGLAYHYRDYFTGCDLTLNAKATMPIGRVG